MIGSLLSTPSVKRNRSSSASTAVQPHRTQHPGAIALSVRSVSSTFANRELSLSSPEAMYSAPFSPEPPCTTTPKSARIPPPVWSQVVSVWQSTQHRFRSDDDSNDTPNSPSSTATSLPSPVLSSSPTRPVFPPLTLVPQDSSSETPLTSTSDLATYYPILLVILLFPISSAVILATLSTLPIPSSLPKTIADVRQLGSVLQAYSESGWTPLLHVLAVLSLTGLWKHAWSIPGAAVLVSSARVALRITLV